MNTPKPHIVIHVTKESGKPLCGLCWKPFQFLPPYAPRLYRPDGTQLPCCWLCAVHFGAVIADDVKALFGAVPEWLR